MVPHLCRSEPEGDSIMSDSGVHAAKQQGSKGRGYVKQKKARKKLKCEN